MKKAIAVKTYEQITSLKEELSEVKDKLNNMEERLNQHEQQDNNEELHVRNIFVGWNFCAMNCPVEKQKSRVRIIKYTVL